LNLSNHLALATEVLDILPNPVLVKNEKLEYVWINSAFETLFNVTREQVTGHYDKELFPDRQVAQCNGGDLRVLESGEVDQAVETVYDNNSNPRETITRKSRLSMPNGEVYLVGVMHDLTDVTRANEALKVSQQALEEKSLELARLASTDALTGCLNRRSLDECESRRLQDESADAAAILMDLDNFKRLNDQAGHDCGDAVLKHFCDLVRRNIRKTDEFIRLGGEEFVVFTSGGENKDSAMLAERIREQFSSLPFDFAGKQYNLSVSIGVVHKPQGTRLSMEDCLKAADENLYKAKETGRNRVVFSQAA
jgi:diguanylate cyclase (GGDEF)-like protein